MEYTRKQEALPSRDAAARQQQRQQQHEEGEALNIQVGDLGYGQAAPELADLGRRRKRSSTNDGRVPHYDCAS